MVRVVLPKRRQFMEKDEQDFKGQLKYEHFQFFFRKHWVKFIQPILFSIPVGLLVLVILIFLGRLTLFVDITFIRAFYIIFTLLISVGFLLLGTLQIFNFYFDMVIVTDSRILIIRKTCFLKNNSDAIDLTKIQDIAVESHGILRNYLRYGRLIITLSTSAPPIVIDKVPDPHFYLEWTNRVKREHILKRRTVLPAKPEEQRSAASSDYLRDIRNLNL
ncbi:PH domain-containing protein [Candidatus Peregrinibacteria bacterium]|nr:PH domain-containing protein [Candidatus Peregrinibacteria bacterium]